MNSRWVDHKDEDDEHDEERKRKKLEKRRLREEKQRISSATTTVAAPDLEKPNGEESTRPHKRQRTASPSHDRVSGIVNPSGASTRTFHHSKKVDEYDILNNIEEGSYGFVSRARLKTSGEIVALKRLKIDRNVEGFPVTGLREIQTLQACSHQHIVNLREVVVGGISLQEWVC